MELAGKYTTEELNKFCYMIALIAQALEENMEDILGRIFMEAGLGSAQTGQFFTPFSISMAMARLNINDIPQTGKIRLHEPACGAGGMIIATCKVLRERGIDYQRRLDVVAQDLDWRAVFMTYLQLSLLGCRAIVCQGNTLTDPYHVGYPRGRCMETPAWMGLIV
jgi:type I restriction-modification system DNA methylase subunit